MYRDIQLHVFTNTVDTAPHTGLIDTTYRSFCDTFGHVSSVTVWCDRHPNVDSSPGYIDNLRQIFPVVHETKSLSDGYVRAVTTSTCPWLFMLEHDWKFLSGVKHTLDLIVSVMQQENILHLRFNKRPNIAKKSDKNLKSIEHPIMPYCTTSFLSNNPHIINRELYLKQALPLITVREKTFGIEKDLSQGQLQGAIYGAIDYPATIEHLDGKTFSNQ